MLHHNALPAFLLDRGVYDAPYLIQGCPALILVTSEGEIIGPVRVRADVRRDDALSRLEALLDAIDPTPSPTPALRLLGD